MRSALAFALLLIAAPALADDPPASPAAPADEIAWEPGAFKLRTTRQAPPIPSCTGRLHTTADVCQVAFRLSTSAAATLLDVLLPIQRRLTPFSGLVPPPGTRRDAPPGTWITGFSSDPTFVGLGTFEMRDAR